MFLVGKHRHANCRVKPHNPTSLGRPLLASDTDQPEIYLTNFIPAFLTWQQSFMTKSMVLSGQTWASH